MKTITIKSKYEHIFDVYGIELITSIGVVQVAAVYVNREEAEHMGQYYYNNGWPNPNNDVRYKVYQVNITELNAYC